MLDGLGGQLDRELRAVTDSPVFLGPSDDGFEPEGLYPTGNFHAQALTLLLDSAAIALTQVLNLLEKRLHRLLDARFSGLPDQLTPDPGRRSGLVTVHKQVIGLVAQARGLAAPASIHALDASAGQEDIQAYTLLAAGSSTASSMRSSWPWPTSWWRSGRRASCPATRSRRRSNPPFRCSRT